MIALGIIFLIIAGFLVGLAIYAFIDEEFTTSLGCGFLAVFIFMFGSIFVLSYVDEKISTNTVCCGEVLSIDEKFCPYCGEKNPLVKTVATCCPNCGNEKLDGSFCSECGNKVSTTSTNEINYCSNCGDSTCHNIKCD